MRASSLADLLTAAAVRDGQSTALVCSGRQWSFAELDALAGRVAACLLSIGIEQGDRVTLWAANSVEWVIAYYGALRAGAVMNPLNFLLSAEEVAYAVGDCGASVLFAGASKSNLVAHLKGRGALKHLICLGDVGPVGLPTLSSVIEEFDPLPPIAFDSSAPAAILYTSGTTGRPKGAILSHRALLLNAALTAQMHGRTERDVVVTALPLPHVYGAAILNAAVLTGMKLVLHAQFKEAEILTDIERERVTMFEGVPTMYHYLMAYADLERYDVSSLTRCTVGGQTMPLVKMQEVERRLGCPLIELWGMTELGGLGTTHASWASSRLGSIGVALPHMEVRIAALDSEENDPAQGTAGELCVRGPLVMQGYFGNPTATAEAIDGQGWLHTGDIAYRDADGYVFIVDRKKDMILTAGYNVYPAEIERVIAAHPVVAMVAVGRIADDAKGELAKAYIVLRPGTSATTENILEHCRQSLAAYKIPKLVQFVTDLPKTSTGKVLRRELQSLDESGNR